MAGFSSTLLLSSFGLGICVLLALWILIDILLILTRSYLVVYLCLYKSGTTCRWNVTNEMGIFLAPRKDKVEMRSHLRH